MKKLLAYTLAIITAIMTTPLALTAARAADSAVVVSSCTNPPVTYVVGRVYPITMAPDGTLCTVGGGGGGGNVTITSPIGQAANAASVATTLSSDQTQTHSAVQGVTVYIADPSTGTPIPYNVPTNVDGRTANGAAAANPPVIIGGTSTGGPTGNVGNLKVDSSGNASVIDSAAESSLSTIAGAVGSAIPSGTALIGKVGVDQTTPGTTNNVTVSTNVGTLPLVQATTSVPITFTAAGGPTQIIGASGSTKIYITHIHYVLSGAGTFALVTGTGTNCGTGTAYLEGASGHPLSYVANGGLTAGGGLGPIYVTGAGGEVCAITTGAVDTSGVISYAQF